MSKIEYLAELLSVQLEQADKTAAKMMATGKLNEEGMKSVGDLRDVLKAAAKHWKVIPEDGHVEH